jgi:hypothetical protein
MGEARSRGEGDEVTALLAVPSVFSAARTDVDPQE